MATAAAKKQPTAVPLPVAENAPQGVNGICSPVVVLLATRGLSVQLVGSGETEHRPPAIPD